MSDEDAFNAYLDAHPDDGHARTVFADWLDDRGDPRAAGYRRLGELGRCPYERGSGDWLWFMESPHDSPWRREDDPSVLYDQWHDEVESWKSYPSRRAAEDAAALAFSKLPASVRDAILTGATA